MRNIVAYGGGALALYDEIVAAKQKVGMDATRHATLTRLRPLIAAVYARHEKAGAKLEDLTAEGKLLKNDRKALFHCYDVATEPLARFKRAVLEAVPREISNKCPYCGLDSTGADDESQGEWDHYLPRRTKKSINGGYAELSVHPLNLLPCCGVCNKHKGDSWRNGKQRIFINVYTDDIDQTRPLLEARIHIHGGEAKAEYDFVGGPGTPFSMHFMRHCRALKLRERYAREARSELTALRREIARRARRERRDAGWFLDDLRDRARDEAAALGINHWKPTLLRAAGGSRDFVLHCLDAAGIVAAPGAGGGEGS